MDSRRSVGGIAKPGAVGEFGDCQQRGWQLPHLDILRGWQWINTENLLGLTIIVGLMLAIWKYLL